MNELTTHTIDSAPEGSKPFMEAATAKYGFTPNLVGALAGSPAALEGYMAVSAAFGKTSLSAVEQQVVLMTVSNENACTYCMAAHSTVVSNMPDAPEGLLEALRAGKPSGDPKLDALAGVAREMVMEDGWLSESTVDAFYAAGYGEAQLLEVLIGLAQKTISNYVNHMAHTKLDPAFEAQAWIPAQG